MSRCRIRPDLSAHDPGKNLEHDYRDQDHGCGYRKHQADETHVSALLGGLALSLVGLFSRSPAYGSAVVFFAHSRLMELSFELREALCHSHKYGKLANSVA